MRSIIPIIITIALIWILDHSLGSLPALGRLLDPVNGWAANAESVNKDYTQDIHIKGLQQPVTIWMEDRMVPHLRANNDHDLYFAQGYIHAYFRLWQMDMQTRAAGGRVSEVVGKKAFDFDHRQRRKGMVFAAENSLRVVEAEPRTKLVLDAYTEGVNQFIHSLNYRNFPLEYKLMGFVPEDWTNLKSALLMKYMADDLTGYTEDFPLTYLRDRLPKEDFEKLFPEKIPGYKPVIPEGTKFEKPSLAIPSMPGIPDSLFVSFKDKSVAGKSDIKHQTSDESEYQTEGVGSNNWAVSGSHTSSGAPILCNDPHLGLNLPSLWFEVQLQAPGVNTYGVSLPGAPGVVIGFNDSISWGFTNNYRDVKDFYMIDAVNNGNDSYWFNGQQKAFNKRVEVIKVKGEPDFKDTVLYTLHGPVMYDEHFIDPAKTGKKIAMTWMAHRATNELLALYKMNRAHSYAEFTEGIMHFICPAQNMIYADRAGNIAIWGQGQFINKWKDQGKYVMEGKDSLTLWGQNIPMSENPHVINPPQGYIASANQTVTDDTYPYWYNGHFLEFRSWEINYYLKKMDSLKQPANKVDMGEIQNNVHSYLAVNIYDALQRIVLDPMNLSEEQKQKAMHGEHTWNRNLDANDQSATMFQIWWSVLYADIWKDDFSNVPESLWPTPEVTMQLILQDSVSKWYDDHKTPQKENLRDIVQRSFKEAKDSVAKLNKAEWYKVKNTTIAHLTKLPAFSYDSLKVGGWGNTINAVKKDHGPSWRMIVEMGKDSISALGVYPGGQSGNPGSKFYGDFIPNWVEGKYYSLLFLPNAEKQQSNRIKYTWMIKP